MTKKIEGKVKEVVEDFFRNYIDIRCDEESLLIIFKVLTERIMKVIK